jgi:hypothetical protein
VVGRYADDALLASLIGELSMKSAEFAAMWADHRVQPCAIAVYDMRHPLLGTLTVTQQSLRAADDQNIVVATTQADTSSREALALLASLVSPPPAPRPVVETPAGSQKAGIRAVSKGRSLQN